MSTFTIGVYGHQWFEQPEFWSLPRLVPFALEFDSSSLNPRGQGGARALRRLEDHKYDMDGLVVLSKAGYVVVNAGKLIVTRALTRWPDFPIKEGS